MAGQDEQLQLVTFRLGDEKYGIDIMDVQEIVRDQEIRAIPNAPLYIAGILNLRGSIIPIINLHERFHFKKVQLSAGEELLSGIIIIKINQMQLGVIIDKVSRVVTIDLKIVQPAPQMITGIGSEYIQGVVREEEGYLIILDISRLFNPRELQQISDISK
ncbi:Chemotaxis protein CheW [subsurface metagenome]